MLLRKEEEGKQEYDQRIRKAESSRPGELNAAIHLTVFDAFLKAEKKNRAKSRFLDQS